MIDAKLARLWINSLRSLAQRDGAVEVTPAEPDDGGVPPSFKTRIFEVGQDGSFLVEMPTLPGAGEHLRQGVAVEVLVVEESQRLIGRCDLVGVSLHELSGGRRTRAMRVTAATEVRSAQRRKFFRVPAGGIDSGPVSLFPVRDGVCGKPSEVIKGVLVNIGGGGIGLLFDNAPRLVATLRATTRFAARIPLPDDDPPLAIDAHVVHMQPQQSKTVYLGLEFDFSEAGFQRSVEDRIQRVSATLQRAQLRRQRGA